MHIDLYTSATCFIFRNGPTEVGRVPLNTLVLEPSRKATAEEIADMNFELELEDYVAGELYKLAQAREPIVLGPVREFTHEVTLRACGNPDMQQYADIAPLKTVRVVGIAEAVAAVTTYQAQHDMGAGNCAKEHGVVWELPKGGKGKRKKVGEVCYNGSYWTVAEKAAWEAEMKAKYATA